jgi:hypothetical protein
MIWDLCRLMRLAATIIIFTIIIRSYRSIRTNSHDAATVVSEAATCA